MMLLLKNFSSFNLCLRKQSVFISKGFRLNTWEVEVPTVDPAGNKLFYLNQVGLSSDIDVQLRIFLHHSVHMVFHTN